MPFEQDKKSVIQLKKTGSTEAAIELCHKMVASYPKNKASVYVLLSEVYFESQHLHLALEKLELAYKEGERGVEYYEILGKILREQGRVPAAIEAFTNALAKKPDAYIYSLRAETYPLDESDLAIKDLRAALQINPKFTLAWCLLAEKFELQKNMGDAISSIKSALKTNPNDPKARRIEDRLLRNLNSAAHPPFEAYNPFSQEAMRSSADEKKGDSPLSNQIAVPNSFASPAMQHALPKPTISSPLPKPANPFDEVLVQPQPAEKPVRAFDPPQPVKSINPVVEIRGPGAFQQRAVSSQIAVVSTTSSSAKVMGGTKP